jgi:hypothetical protein
MCLLLLPVKTPPDEEEEAGQSRARALASPGGRRASSVNTVPV